MEIFSFAQTNDIVAAVKKRTEFGVGFSIISKIFSTFCEKKNAVKVGPKTPTRMSSEKWRMESTKFEKPISRKSNHQKTNSITNQQRKSMKKH